MYFEELQTGMCRDLEPVRVDEEKMLAFAREFNPAPIHTDPEYAAGTPFGRVLAPGMLSFLLCWAKYIEADFFGNELIAGKSTLVEWEKPVFAGDLLMGHAEITALTPRQRSGIAELTLTASNQSGDIVLRSITQAVIRRKP